MLCFYAVNSDNYFNDAQNENRKRYLFKGTGLSWFSKHLNIFDCVGDNYFIVAIYLM